MPSAAKLPQGRSPRRDPAPRHFDSAVWSHLVNKDPDKHYVYVNKGDPDAMAQYEYAGYEVEVLKAGGVRPAGGRTIKEGQPIEVRGMLLHSVSKKRHAEIEMYGADGVSGQQAVDELEARIIDRSGGVDQLRGQHRGLSVVNETEAPKNMVMP